MRRAATAAAIAIVLSIGAPVSAHADEGDTTPMSGCVTFKEFKRVDRHMTQERVGRIFDATARTYRLTRTFYGAQYRMCKHNAGASLVAVMYKGKQWALGSHWRVIDKEWSTSRVTY